MKDKQLRLCFIGKMRSGKSEAIRYLVDKYGEDQVEVVDFGDSLKEVVQIIYPDAFIHGKNRFILQKVGQHMREMDQDVWLKSVDKKIKESNKKIIVCASCRQENEYEYLDKMAFLFAKVDCKDSTRIKRAEDSGDVFKLKDFTHETEEKLSFFRWDYLLDNNHDKEYLHLQIERMLEDIGLEEGGK